MSTLLHALAHPLEQPHVMGTFGRVPIALSHGQGMRVWDVNGKEYLDALAGIAVNTLGHNHPRLVPALQDQISKIMHGSNYYFTPHAEALAAKLCQHAGLTNVFFCNSGLEANEAAIKLARKFGHDKGITNPQIVVYEKAFHGRSIATLAATGNPKVQQGFGPLLPGFIRVPLNNIEALQAATANNPNITAVFLEAIQGEGGVNPAHMEYLQAVRQLCNANDWLLMIDEVQCGMGRTGKWFAHQWADIQPDVMPLAKGLASGVPIGAVVAGPKAAKIFTPGSHGSTFGGQPLAMRAVYETLCIMEDDNLLANAANIGQYIKTHLQQALQTEQQNGDIKDIRGQGLMIGIELARPCGALVNQCAHAGLLISVTADCVVRLLPPLIINRQEADALLDILVTQIKTFLTQTPPARLFL